MAKTIIDLAALDGSDGFRVNGGLAGDKSGYSIEGIGDFNGDGFDDIAVGAERANSSSGVINVLFGAASGFAGTSSVNDLDGADGFRLEGFTNNAFRRTTGGDVNGDGKADLLTGSGAFSFTFGNDGVTTVLLGTDAALAADIIVTDLDGADGFRFIGGEFRERVGQDTVGIGDFNGDGIGDFMAGGYGTTVDGDSTAGITHIVFGQTSALGRGNFFAGLDGTDGMDLKGFREFQFSGRQASEAGDMNADGLAGVAIAGFGDGSQSDGEVFIVFGRDDGLASLSLDTLDGAGGFRFSGLGNQSYTGRSLRTAGDINGDGFDDFIIGSYGDDTTATNAGRAAIIFGSASGFPASFIDTDLDGSDGFIIDGLETRDNLGAGVDTAGDFNGDGFDDIGLGSPYADPNAASNSGSTYIVFGGDHAGLVIQQGTSASETVTGNGQANVMVLGQGDDIFNSSGGDDVVRGGEGRDTGSLGGGNDRAFGGAGR